MLACACCGKENGHVVLYCSKCMAPMELARSVAARGEPARFVSILGSSGAGKTVYVGFLLDMLTRGCHGLEGLPHGSFSVSVQQQTMQALQNRRFPQKTPTEADSWRWVHCEVSQRKKRRKRFDIIAPDVAGEALALEIEQPNTYQTIRSAVLRSEALLILIDSLRARDSGRDEDYFAMKLGSYICALHSEKTWKVKRRLQLPTAVIFTKSDSCPEALDDPSAFAAANLPGFVRFCQRNFRHHALFAAGVVGSSAVSFNNLGQRIRIPLHTEPRGIIEPLEWIMGLL